MHLNKRLVLTALVLSPIVTHATPLTTEQLQQLPPTESMVLAMLYETNC